MRIAITDQVLNMLYNVEIILSAFSAIKIEVLSQKSMLLLS